jgi:hypothetical protein
MHYFENPRIETILTDDSSSFSFGGEPSPLVVPLVLPFDKGRLFIAASSVVVLVAPSLRETRVEPVQQTSCHHHPRGVLPKFVNRIAV